MRIGLPSVREIPLQDLQQARDKLPQTTFFEGVEGCRKAYLRLLESTTEIFELGVHDDLAHEMGEVFMNTFIQERIKRGIFLKAIGQKTPWEEELRIRDCEELREIRWFEVPGLSVHSSVALFDDKVLLLNLHQEPFALIMENVFIAQTIRTLFLLLWNGVQVR